MPLLGNETVPMHRLWGQT